MPNHTVYEDPDYWPDTCPQHEDDWTEEEEEEFNIIPSEENEDEFFDYGD